MKVIELISGMTDEEKEIAREVLAEEKFKIGFAPKSKGDDGR